jgi:hypothetical protein
MGQQSTLIYILFAILLVATIASFAVAFKSGSFLNLFTVPLLMGLFVFGYFWSYRSTKLALADAAQAINPDTPPAQRVPVPSAFLQRVQALPRPRRVRLRFIYVPVILLLFFAVFLAGAIVMLATESWRAFLQSDQFWILLMLLGLLPVIAFVIINGFFEELKKRSIMRNGEVTAAKIVAQKTIDWGRHSYSNITYEFHAPGGPLIRKTERDDSKLIYEDMLIPVFYQAGHPNNCFAVSSTCFRLPDAEN